MVHLLLARCREMDDWSGTTDTPNERNKEIVLRYKDSTSERRQQPLYRVLGNASPRNLESRCVPFVAWFDRRWSMSCLIPCLKNFKRGCEAAQVASRGQNKRVFRSSAKRGVEIRCWSVKIGHTILPSASSGVRSPSERSCRVAPLHS